MIRPTGLTSKNRQVVSSRLQAIALCSTLAARIDPTAMPTRRSRLSSPVTPTSMAYIYQCGTQRRDVHCAIESHVRGINNMSDNRTAAAAATTTKLSTAATITATASTIAATRINTRNSDAALYLGVVRLRVLILPQGHGECRALAGVGVYPHRDPHRRQEPGDLPPQRCQSPMTSERVHEQLERTWTRTSTRPKQLQQQGWGKKHSGLNRTRGVELGKRQHIALE